MHILRRLSLPIFVGCVYAMLYVPIIVLVVFSFNKAPMMYGWGGFTLHWFGELFRSSEILFAMKNSFIVAFSSTFLSLLFGMMLVYSFKARLDRLALFFYLPLLVPEIVLAVGFLYLFSFLNVPFGLPTLIVAHTLLGLAFAVPLLHARFSEMQANVMEASMDLGASRLQTFVRVVLPFLRPALFSAGMIAWIISFDDFLISFFCAGSSSQTLPLYIYARIRIGVTPIINALSTFTLLVSCLLVAIYSSIDIESKDIV
jgi:spermidine/putrescine transport system permease protein